MTEDDPASGVESEARATPAPADIAKELDSIALMRSTDAAGTRQRLVLRVRDLTSLVDEFNAIVYGFERLPPEQKTR